MAKKEVAEARRKMMADAGLIPNDTHTEEKSDKPVSMITKKRKTKK